MSNSVKSKAAAAKHGCLSARHWQDIRLAARLARSEDITLIMHGVTVTPRGKENQPQVERNSVTTARGGRGQPTESVSKACEYSSEQQHEQRAPKKQRDKQRSLVRLHEFQQTMACGARWLPLVQKLLRRGRAISRSQVWTEHLERRLALREKMRAFLGRVTHYASQCAKGAKLAPLVERDRAENADVNTPAIDKLRQMVYDYDGHVTLLEARRMRWACSSANARAHMRDLFTAYRNAWDVEAACAGLEPKDTNTNGKPLATRSTRQNQPDLSPREQHGAKRTAKPTKGGRSRGRR